MHIGFFYIFIPVHKWLHKIYYQWLYYNIHSSRIVKINVIDKCMWYILFQNIWIYPIYANINVIINYQYNPHSNYFSCSIFIRGVMVIIDDTYSHFYNSIICVTFNLLGGYCQYNFNFSFPYYWGRINYFIMKTWY